MTTYWIAADIGREKELKGLGVVLGPRVGEHWERCTIPDEAEAAMLDRWGPVMFGPEGGIRRAIMDQLEASIRKDVRITIERARPDMMKPPAVVIKRKPARRIK